jgi:hypothetical protein
MRRLTAFGLYHLGDLIWRAFDRWTAVGMHGPIYRIQSGLMEWSDRVQGDGPGPWLDAAGCEEGG